MQQERFLLWKKALEVVTLPSGAMCCISSATVSGVEAYHPVAVLAVGEELGLEGDSATDAYLPSASTNPWQAIAFRSAPRRTRKITVFGAAAPSVRQLTGPGDGLSGNLAIGPRNRFPHPKLDTPVSIKSGESPEPGVCRALAFNRIKEKACTGSPDSGPFF